MDGIDINSVAGLRPAATPASAAAAAPARPVEAPKPKAPGTDVFALIADASTPIDAKKVEAIRSLIAAGRYPIDERAIAARMIALDVAEK